MTINNEHLKIDITTQVRGYIRPANVATTHFVRHGSQPKSPYWRTTLLHAQTREAKTRRRAYVCRAWSCTEIVGDVNPCTYGPLIADVIKRIAVDTT